MASPALAPKKKIGAAPKFAALYIRVSTADQGDRYSPEIQLAKLMAKAKQEGFTVRREDIFTDTESGKKIERPEFEKLRARVKTRCLQAVIVLGVDRLSRKSYDAALIRVEFKRYGCDLDFVEMKNDDSPEGRYMFNQYASMAEYIGEKIVQKSQEAHAKMRGEGRIPGRTPIYGHDRHPSEKGKRVVNKVEQGWIEKMAERVLAGHSLYSIASWLNGLGVKSKNGGLWSQSVVQQTLEKRQLIGEHLDGGVMIPVPRVLPNAVYFAVQKRITENGAHRRGRKPLESLLAKYVYCKACGINLTTRRYGNGARIYVCAHRTMKPPTHTLCHAKRKVFLAIPAENNVFGLIWSMLTDPRLLHSQAQAYIKSLPKPKNASSLNAVQRELETAQRAYRNIVQRCDEGHGSFAESKPKLDALKAKIAKLEAEANAIAPVMRLPEVNQIDALLREIYDGDAPTDNADRRDILEGLQNLRIEYDNVDTLTITGSVSLGSAQECKQDRSQRSDLICTPAVPLTIPFILRGRVA